MSACVTVETGREGPICAPACASDAACKVDEGYLCDPVWGACLLPNVAAIVPKQCRGTATRDPAFGPSELAIAPPPPITPSAAIATTATGWFAAWRDAEAIELATSADGITWSAKRDVAATDGSELGAPILAANATMLYAMYGTGDHGLRVRASRDRGATFGEPVTPLAGAYGNAVIDDTGALHIVTINGTELGGYGSAQQTIEYVVSRDRGATFSAPLAISRDEELIPTFFANPSIAVDSRRQWIYVAYLRGGRDAVWDLVVVAIHGKTRTRTVIGDGCAIHLVPNLALDPLTGTLHLAYYDNVGTTGRFVHATCSVGAATCTPQGAINSEPFAVLPLGRKTPISIGDRERIAIDPARRLLEVTWSQPVVDAGVTVVRSFRAAAKLRAVSPGRERTTTAPAASQRSTPE